ncbi:MAG TPA: SDR family oxidoreductase [Baekduia sp.]|uniref:SDR family NAD(P)-dependent oxidoreductase n=1 Tax=Baekduia sp. TaxID=2600305 RepID=UPI002BE2111E|nr:SDR family oxidoreductase [Baekduia sp.]HMJ37731.1 SDR family oxidoreductase [Baekduia sp.]
MELKDRTALLTGAAGGIGTATAQRLAREGTRLVLTGRDQAALETLRASLPGSSHIVLVADLGDRGQVDGLIARAAAAATAPIDVLVNNAGIELSATYHRLTAADIERMIAVNLLAPMLLTHQAIPGMLERGRGEVVQMSSVAGLTGTACCEPYAATKGGLVRFTEALRATYAGTPLGFSTVCPGFTRGGGMYTRMEEQGHRSNALLGTTTVEAVADAVVAAIRDDRPIQVVNGRPLRPVPALAALMPRLGERLMERTGANTIFRRLAAAREPT